MSRFVKKARHIVLPSLLVLFLGGVDQAYAQGFTLSISVKRGDMIAGKTLTDEFNDVTINDGGDIVFTAEFDGGSCGGGGVTLPGCGAFSIQRDQLLYKSGDLIDGQTLQTSGVFFGGLNNNGEVAAFGLFSPPGFPPGIPRLFLHDGVSVGLIVSPGDPVGGDTLSPLGFPVLNNIGTTFFAGLLGSSGKNGAFTNSAGVNTLIATAGTVIGSKTVANINENIGQPDGLNDSDDLAFIGNFSDGSSGVAVRIGGVLALAATTDVPFAGMMLTDVEQPRINNNNEVVFGGTFAGGEGIFSTQRGVLVQTGDSCADTPIVEIGGIKLNDQGEVVFAVNSNSGVCTLNESVFFAGDEVVDDGETFSIVGLGETDLNNNGQVALLLSLEDNGGMATRAIVLAAPNIPPMAIDLEAFRVE